MGITVLASKVIGQRGTAWRWWFRWRWLRRFPRKRNWRNARDWFPGWHWRWLGYLGLDHNPSFIPQIVPFIRSYQSIITTVGMTGSVLNAAIRFIARGIVALFPPARINAVTRFGQSKPGTIRDGDIPRSDTCCPSVTKGEPMECALKRVAQKWAPVFAKKTRLTTKR